MCRTDDADDVDIPIASSIIAATLDEGTTKGKRGVVSPTVIVTTATKPVVAVKNKNTTMTDASTAGSTCSSPPPKKKNTNGFLSFFSTNNMMYKKLHWTTKPSKRLPHGVLGLLTVFFGSYLIFFCSCTGDLTVYGLLPHTDNVASHYYYSTVVVMIQKVILVLFLFFATALAISGYILAPTAIGIAQPVFRRLSIAIMSLVYYAIRFLPDFYNNVPTQLSMVVYGLDVLFCFISVGITISFWKVAYDWFTISPSVSLGCILGSFGMASLCGYPIHLLNPNWFECISERYPAQGSSLVAYAYIPSITIFVITAFLPTLYLRKIITAGTLALLFVLFIPTAVVSSGVIMEYYVGSIANVNLYIPCTIPTDVNSWDYYVMDLLHLSKYNQYMLRELLNIVPLPSKYQYVEK